MNEICFDIEADGLLDTVTKVHCIGFKEGRDKVQVISTLKTSLGNLSQTLTVLEKADVLIGHNILGYDIPAIKKIYPTWHPKGLIRDTLVMSRLQHVHDRHEHNLKSWGKTLYNFKTDYQGGWDTCNQAMVDYCKQDVEVTYALWKKLSSEKFAEESIQLEHSFSKAINWMMKNGVAFNSKKASKLLDEIVKTESALKTELTADILPLIKRTAFTPKVNNKTRGYVKGIQTWKISETPFNPGSRLQCANLFKNRYGWKPTILTDGGAAKISGDILRKLPYPEAPKLADYYDVKKLISQISTGEGSWFNKVNDKGMIHAYVNHNGAVTGRCTHSAPNLAQVPSPRGFKGKECRSLFYVPRGYKMVGCDAKGLELRNLAHYMYRYDRGAYASKILEGDIHTENQKAAHLPTRDHAKTFIYAFLYGAGDVKIGSILEPEAIEARQQIIGRQTKGRFLANLPALKSLIALVKYQSNTKGYLIGLDGRRLYVHSSHVALNVLLQGAGAVFMKKATVLLCNKIFREGLDAEMVLHVHDEFQFRVIEKDVDRVKQLMEESMGEAGEYFNYNIPMEGDSKEGMNWYETH